ncbi:MAG: 16S rRNA (cytidine(1402)-2'-O)-methyltransferase, partial [Proteobacteria bacterium]|nr:16S rRNA (cytidine(1402)-2'-O)-methyltransferase [Pseudomonadota bacterium]
LDDMTPRAISTLKNVDIIAAEDTRNTRKLLTHFGISGKELLAYHDHGEEARAVGLLDRLERDGLTMAVVSDAGTPCIADPGYRLVHLAKQRGIKVHPVPGASAVTTLVSASGLPSDRFTFVGFLPTKAKELKAEITSWSRCGGSIVYFEPTRRLEDSLVEISEVYPAARVSIGRELTKLYEEIVTLPISDALSWVRGHSVLKGEAVVMVDLGASLESLEGLVPGDAKEMITAAARKGFKLGKSLKDLSKELAGAGLSRSELYQLLLDIKMSDS